MRYDEISPGERAAYARFGFEVPRWPLRRELGSQAALDAMICRVGRALALVSSVFGPPEPLLALARRSGPEALSESASDFSGSNLIRFTLAAAGADESRAAALEDELARYLAWVTIDRRFRSPENEARLRRFAAEQPAAKLAIPWGGDERAHAYGRVERQGAALALTVFFRMLEHGLPRLAAYLANHGFAVSFTARSHDEQYLVL